MASNFEITAGTRNEFSKEELAQFIKLVREGGEVSTVALQENIENARLLLLLKDAKGIVGTAALKVPRLSYRARIAEKAEADVPEPQFPYELGYVFITEAARGNGQAARLVARARESEATSGIFATTREDNEPMVKVLSRQGFQATGRSYLSQDGKRKLRLLTKQA